MLTVASAPCSCMWNEPSVAAPKGCVAGVSCCEPLPGMLPSSVVTALEPPEGASLNSGPATVFTVTDCSAVSPSPSVTVTWSVIVSFRPSVVFEDGRVYVNAVPFSWNDEPSLPPVNVHSPLAFVPVKVWPSTSTVTCAPSASAPGVKLRVPVSAASPSATVVCVVSSVLSTGASSSASTVIWPVAVPPVVVMLTSNASARTASPRPASPSPGRLDALPVASTGVVRV